MSLLWRERTSMDGGHRGKPACVLTDIWRGAAQRASRLQEITFPHDMPVFSRLLQHEQNYLQAILLNRNDLSRTALITCWTPLVQGSTICLQPATSRVPHPFSFSLHSNPKPALPTAWPCKYLAPHTADMPRLLLPSHPDLTDNEESGRQGGICASPVQF